VCGLIQNKETLINAASVQTKFTTWPNYCHQHFN